MAWLRRWMALLRPTFSLLRLLPVILASGYMVRSGVRSQHSMVIPAQVIAEAVNRPVATRSLQELQLSKIVSAPSLPHVRVWDPVLCVGCQKCIPVCPYKATRLSPTIESAVVRNRRHATTDDL
jgi:formate hydrogenlyase subunit 6/NADH:ubiquinone oxidoreductase subunit I